MVIFTPFTLNCPLVREYITPGLMEDEIKKTPTSMVLVGVQ